MQCFLAKEARTANSFSSKEAHEMSVGTNAVPCLKVTGSAPCHAWQQALPLFRFVRPPNSAEPPSSLWRVYLQADRVHATWITTRTWISVSDHAASGGCNVIHPEGSKKWCSGMLTLSCIRWRKRLSCPLLSSSAQTLYSPA